jgi:alkylresorcinol/alkylpyrone synthase
VHIASVGSSFPPHYVDQETLIALGQRLIEGRYHNAARARQIFENVLVGGRHFAVHPEELVRFSGFTEANSAWIRVAQEVGERALQHALDQAGLKVEDLDALFTVTVTGLAVPSLDARLINRMGLRSDLKRVPIFGLGCLAGAAGVARVADYLKGHPKGVAALLSVELCSLTLQLEDLSIPNIIATGLFGDGAACAVMTGAERAESGPVVVASRSVFYRDTERVMGWDIGSSGFKIVLSAEVPEMVKKHLRGNMDRFLADNGLDYQDIRTWVCHPGGPKVLEAMEEAFPLPANALAKTWKSLREVGNLSSTSILLILQATMQDPPPPNSYGMMVAMGPGFCSELVLLRW